MSPEETVRGQSAEGRQRDAADCVDELKDVKESLAEAEEALEGARESALHDFLTKLSNRELFEEKLSTAIAIAGRRRWSLAVFFIDIDSFKAVNDAVGHEAGDTVLKETARRLLECSREEDTVARHGGDEFIYLLIDPQNRKNITAIVSRLLERVSRPIEIGGQSLAISVSLGISVYPDDGQESERLIQNSDTAMYRAKNQKTGWQFYSNETSSQSMVPSVLRGVVAAARWMRMIQPGRPQELLAQGSLRCGAPVLWRKEPDVGLTPMRKLWICVEAERLKDDLVVTFSKWQITQSSAKAIYEALLREENDDLALLFGSVVTLDQRFFGLCLTPLSLGAGQALPAIRRRFPDTSLTAPTKTVV